MANNCPNCDHKIDTETVYKCPKCDYKFWQSEEAFNKADQRDSCYCTICGKIVDSDSNFCTSCGNSVGDESSYQNKKNNSKKSSGSKNEFDRDTENKIDALVGEVKKAFKKPIYVGLAWLIAGSIITFGSYSNAENGGSYSIFWGAIIYGAYKMIKSLVSYLNFDATSLREEIRNNIRRDQQKQSSQSDKKGGHKDGKTSENTTFTLYCYELLNCSQNDCDETIKKQYRKLALENHPDKAPIGKEKDFQDKFVLIKDAYEHLKIIRGIS
jgi:DNA-directed RNA polymerase subunit RPC12/RpoP